MSESQSRVEVDRSAEARPLVVVVDDDDSVRESLPALLKELGYGSEVFSSAEQLLASSSWSAARCIILDIGLPQMSGPDLHRELIRRGRRVPVVFITARSEKSITPGMLHGGAMCLFKPFSDKTLSAALDAALGKI